jgi:hypothetical protein
MSRNLVIDVNVNPNSQPLPTETRVTTTNEALSTQSKTGKNAVQSAILLSVARRGISVATSNIGQLTGSQSAQRKAQTTATLITYGLAAIDNPLVAGLSLAFEIGTAAVDRAIDNRNVQNEVQYKQQLRTATYNSGRKR